MKKILMLHGINHNMFGKRDPVQYGTITLAEIDERMSNIHAREAFRHHSVFGEIGRGQICGCGVDSYRLGLVSAAGGA